LWEFVLVPVKERKSRSFASLTPASLGPQAAPLRMTLLGEVGWHETFSAVVSHVSGARHGAPKLVLMQDKSNCRSFDFAQDDTAL
jgi:hypothetical protein